MGKIPIGIQLYSVREDCAQDLPGTIAKLAAMGYDGVEFAGYYDYSAADLRKMLDDNGIKCCGTHTGIQTVLGDALKTTVEYNKILGNKYLIVPGLPEEYRNSRDAWRKTADFFNDLAGKLKPHDMLTGYHNHWIEFAEMDGELPWDTFFGNTVEDVVMQIDTGNALHGGADAAPFLRKYPNRARTVHLKEFSETNEDGVIGEGDVKWEDFFQAVEEVGNTDWYIVEYERSKPSRMALVEKSLQALKAMGK